MLMKRRDSYCFNQRKEQSIAKIAHYTIGIRLQMKYNFAVLLYHPRTAQNVITDLLFHGFTTNTKDDAKTTAQ